MRGGFFPDGKGGGFFPGGELDVFLPDQAGGGFHPDRGGGAQPTSVADLLFWHRADDPGIVEAGSGVSTWPDKSANARTLTQGTDANRMTKVAGVINGYPVIRSAAGKFMSWTPFAAPAVGTVYAVVRFRTAATFQLFLNLNGSGPNLYLGIDGANVNKPACFAGSARAIWSSAIADTTHCLVKFSWDMSGAVNSTYYTQVGDDTEVTETVGDSLNAGSFVSLALDPAISAAQPLVSDLADLFGYGRNTSASEEATVRAYVAGRYALAM